MGKDIVVWEDIEYAARLVRVYGLTHVLVELYRLCRDGNGALRFRDGGSDLFIPVDGVDRSQPDVCVRFLLEGGYGVSFGRDYGIGPEGLDFSDVRGLDAMTSAIKRAANLAAPLLGAKARELIRNGET